MSKMFSKQKKQKYIFPVMAATASSAMKNFNPLAGPKDPVQFSLSINLITHYVKYYTKYYVATFLFLKVLIPLKRCYVFCPTQFAERQHVKIHISYR
jgi:hypothetical protein